jgi:hypothetical protein
MIASFPEVAAYSPRCESCGRERDGEEKAEEREAEAATGRTGRGKYKAMKKQYYEHYYVRTLQVRSPSLRREGKAMPGMPGMPSTFQKRPPGQAPLRGIINRICSEFPLDNSMRGGRECAKKPRLESSEANRAGNSTGDEAALVIEF